jgi:hypothetical protein
MFLDLEAAKHGTMMEAAMHRMVNRRMVQAACMVSIAIVGYIIRFHWLH